MLDKLHLENFLIISRLTGVWTYMSIFGWNKPEKKNNPEDNDAKTNETVQYRGTDLQIRINYDSRFQFHFLITCLIAFNIPNMFTIWLVFSMDGIIIYCLHDFFSLFW